MQPVWSEVIARLTLAQNEAEFCGLVEMLACQLCDTAGAQFLVYNPDQDTLTSPLREEGGISLNEETLAGTCALFCETSLLDPASEDRVPGMAISSFQSAAAVPVKAFGSLSGVLTVVAQARLTQTVDLARLEELAAIAGILREGVVAREDALRFQASNLDLLVRAVDAFPGTPRGHVNRVARLASELALVLGLSSEARQTLWQAAQYHDVGKLSLGHRSAEDVNRFHSQAGATFLSSSRELRRLASLVETHHERYDGSGYPSGLSGDALPLDAWLLCLAEHVEESHGSIVDFVAEHGARHHPEALEALRVLAESGRLPGVAG